MKKIFITVICLCVVCGSLAFAGDKVSISDLPAKISAYMKENYPKITTVEWDFEKDENLYEAEFDIRGMEYKLRFSPEGVLQYAKEDIHVSDIPETVKQAALKKHSGYQIIGANRLFIRGAYIYDVAVKGKNAYGNTRHDHTRFDSKGNIVPEH